MFTKDYFCGWARLESFEAVPEILASSQRKDLETVFVPETGRTSYVPRTAGRVSYVRQRTCTLKPSLTTARGTSHQETRGGVQSASARWGGGVGACAKFRRWNRAPAPSSAAGPAESARSWGCRKRRAGVPRKGGRLRTALEAGGGAGRGARN